MKPAVIVIDVQSALCSGEYAAFEAPQMIERINALTRAARAASVPVIFVQHQSSDGPLLFQTAGWQLASGLECELGDLCVHKTATDSFHKTELDELLRKLGVTELVICGLQSEFCVDTTVRRALALGYPVTLVADAHSTIDNGVLKAEQIIRHHTLTLTSISGFGPRVIAMPASEVTFAAQLVH